MKYIALAWGIMILYLFASYLILPRQPAPQPHYTIKHFCEEHPDICSHNRLANYHTPTPIPQGTLVIIP
jgi:hypothetical protein